MRKWLIGLGTLFALIAAAFILSPWPSVLIIRAIFDKGAADASAALEKHVPPNISSRTAIRYDERDPDALLDIHAPANAQLGALPAIIWVHGGGFVSGRREDITNYLKVLAGRGFITVNADYTIAPEAKYPRPVEQANLALGFISAKATQLGIDPNKLIIAGDSAGAQIAAQLANIVTNPSYAKAVGTGPAISPSQLKGALLFCGPYDLELFGSGGWFSRTTTWAYSGNRDYRANESFQLFSVAKHIGSGFPPSFITAGNGDPLLEHSLLMVKALQDKGVATDTLFFPTDRKPPLAHEYQFDLDSAAGREALDRSVAFAKRVSS
jgi:acetyl esterase/lipase